MAADRSGLAARIDLNGKISMDFSRGSGRSAGVCFGDHYWVRAKQQRLPL